MLNNKSTLCICTDIDAAARLVLENSFAILQVDQETHKALENSWNAAKSFLSPKINQDPSQEADTLKKCRIIRNGALLGYNSPSSTKLLFRSLFTDGEPDPSQPWGDDEVLQASSTLLGNKLHCLLTNCLKAMMKVVEQNKLSENSKNSSMPKPKKRRKISDPKDTIVPKKMCFKSTHCPMDYFLYHNEHDGVNCSQHIDRGVLICILLTNVAGLEVLSNSEHEKWLCPESVFINQQLYRERESGCSNMVCILSADQLKKVLHADKKMIAKFRGLNACIHRVRQNLAAARLSISYELRLAST